MINGSKVHVHHGDCIDVMKLAPSESFDAIVCDPPYGLEFMGKEWDSFRGDAWRSSAGITGTGYTDGGKRLPRPSYGGGDSANPTCATCGGRKRGAKKCGCPAPEWRVKGQPLDQRQNNAAQMRAFGAWCESWARECLRVLKPGGHLLAFGGTRTWHRLAVAIEDAGFEMRDSIAWLYGSGFPKSLDVSKAIDKAAGAEREVVPATPDAERWQGWGTALKPAFEPIVVARKPLAGTVAANVLQYGTGGLNIDGCRVGTDGGSTQPSGMDRLNAANAAQGYRPATYQKGTPAPPLPAGRWPANVVLDEATASEVDKQSGERKSGGKVKGVEPSRTGDNGIYGAYGRVENKPHQDSGGASRFFYVAKASTKERPRYVDESGKKIAHPTVKPLTLMRWLVRLVCQPGGWVLDPFAGSGAALEAAVLEGFNVVGIEREPEYLPLIQQRLDRILSA